VTGQAGKIAVAKGFYLSGRIRRNWSNAVYSRKIGRIMRYINLGLRVIQNDLIIWS
jgi:hypothetical protein